MNDILDNSHFITQSEVNKFLLATLLCGLIGAEREYRSKSAGLKTMMMIGLGSALFTILSIRIGLSSHDRIASNIVTGIGFLGAGVIFKEENRVKGLTTACIIWIVAAIGMAVGSGFYEQAIGVTAVVLLALIIFPFLEEIGDRRFTKRIYRIVKKQHKHGDLESYEEVFRENRLKPQRGKHQLVNNIITGNWVATGTPKNHKKFVERMLKDDDIIEFDF
ncbi:MgtC/SapB family protein [Pedobacter rhizosphaerae]|uniref:Putative Mg2+ transporter-C (MgtC) family protein n=1 Tax=Pedobacter rhizosphaerae TaxID=390241 RepID=A0A1H9J4R0_9SPHI|nr:MgtC/SapB family protein [Pedobacter rhizosphaerae]SEQ81719.1 putative Mg2+ transporter-C (MgtC) family protein [Pedobacter rhizosphaerae]